MRKWCALSFFVASPLRGISQVREARLLEQRGAQEFSLYCCAPRTCLPPWPNGQGVGLLIRRLRVRVPQGVPLGTRSRPRAHWLRSSGTASRRSLIAASKLNLGTERDEACKSIAFALLQRRLLVNADAPDRRLTAR